MGGRIRRPGGCTHLPGSIRCRCVAFARRGDRRVGRATGTPLCHFQGGVRQEGFCLRPIYHPPAKATEARHEASRFLSRKEGCGPSNPARASMTGSVRTASPPPSRRAEPRVIPPSLTVAGTCALKCSILHGSRPASTAWACSPSSRRSSPFPLHESPPGGHQPCR